MDRINSMKIFTRVVESHSFVRTGKSLGLTTAQVSRTIQALEAHLGARLLHRTTRYVSLTQEGEAYYERCVRFVAELEEIEAEITQAKLNPKGTVKVILPSLIAKSIIIPALPEFFSMYPDIQVQMGLSDHQVDIVEKGVDCVIRVGELEDSGLIARRIGNLPRVTCAAPSYLAKYGEPKTLQDLRSHIAVNYVSSNTGRTRAWDFLVDGKIASIDMRGVVAVNEVDSYVTCGLQGLGLLKGALFPLSPYITTGALRVILKNYPSPSRPISIMFARNQHLPRKLRVFMDWVADLFKRSQMTQAPEPATSNTGLQ
jgi:LysR family transcriptional regulator, regulator for bpeEF and oprC